MATNVLMPALSPTMTEGRLSRWLKQEGDGVAPGDVLAEIETDKATMEVEAVDEGVLGRILVVEGTDGVAVNTPIAVLLADGESADAVGAPAAVPEAGAPPIPTDASGGVDVPAGSREVPAPREASSPPRAAPPQERGGRPVERVFASPLARRIAREIGVALETIRGSGPHGRIVRSDVETQRAAAPAPASAAPRQGTPAEATRAAPAAAPVAAPSAAPRPAPVPVTAAHAARPNSSMRKAIARRLAASMQDNPHFYVGMDIELDALLELRAKLNAKSPADGPGAYKLSVNDMLIKAAAIAHRRVPGVAVTYTEDAILHYETIDISVAVSIPDGLITPIIRDADRKGLAAISNEARDLFARARTGKLKPEEYQGGGFSLSNLGMFGVSSFTAIINPPQAAILAVGAGEKRPVVRGDALAIATVMTCTLSSDHRAVDGALAAQWMGAFKHLVQDPLELML